MKSSVGLIFWTIVTVVLVILFALTGGSLLYSFYFTSLFMPVIIATSYVLTRILIPEYLLKERYGRFFLYCFYLLIISTNLQMIIVFVSLYMLTLYDTDNIPVLINNYSLLPLIMYIIVILYGFIFVLVKFMELNKPKNAGDDLKQESLLVKSGRKQIALTFNKIVYIESMSDYLKIIISDGQIIRTRETISSFENKLPGQFLRIHRSFIINLKYMISFSKSIVNVNGTELPVSRTYKTNVNKVLSGL